MWITWTMVDEMNKMDYGLKEIWTIKCGRKEMRWNMKYEVHNVTARMMHTIHKLFFCRHEKCFTFFFFWRQRSQQITWWCFSIFLPSKLHKFCNFLLKNILHQKVHIEDILTFQIPYCSWKVIFEMYAKNTR